MSHDNFIQNVGSGDLQLSADQVENRLLVDPTTMRMSTLEKMEHAMKFPATSIVRKKIRKYVHNATRRFLTPGAILDVGAGYRDNSPEAVHFEETQFYTLDKVLLPNIDFVIDFENENPFSPGQFSAVICTEVLEHAAHPDRLLSNISTVLKPDGIVVITVPFWKEIHAGEHYSDYWRFTETGLELLLASFEILELQRSCLGDRPLGIFAIARKSTTHE